MKNLSIFCAISVLLWCSNGAASSKEICIFKAEVANVTKSHLVIKNLKTVVSPGFNAEMEKLRCTGKIKNDRIPLKGITEGKKHLKKGAKIKLDWNSYSAMTPNGPTNSIYWRILPQ